MRVLGENGSIVSFTARKRIAAGYQFAGTEGDNLCGPCLLKVPSWVASPLGTYYLWCSSHEKGDAANPVGEQRIKLLYTSAGSIAAAIGSPWTVHAAGSWTLAAIEAFDITYLHDAINAHIGSLCVRNDQAGEVLQGWVHGQALMWGHGSAYATSTDGITWTVAQANATDGIYLATFKYGSTWYAIEDGLILRRSSQASGSHGYSRQASIEPFRADAMAAFSGGETVRHCGVEVIGTNAHVYYTARGDTPERVYKGVIDLTVANWENWVCDGHTEIMRPEYDFEGAFLTLDASGSSTATNNEREIRDPYPFTDPADGSRWLVYAAAGEHGIGIMPLAAGQ